MFPSPCHSGEDRVQVSLLIQPLLLPLRPTTTAACAPCSRSTDLVLAYDVLLCLLLEPLCLYNSGLGPKSSLAVEGAGVELTCIMHVHSSALA